MSLKQVRPLKRWFFLAFFWVLWYNIATFEGDIGMSSDMNQEFENIDVEELTEEDEAIILGSADEVSISLEEDEYFDEEDDKKFKRRGRIFWGVLMFINALLITGLLYMNFFMYNPQERDLCDDNLFCGKNLSISSSIRRPWIGFST